MNKYAIGFVFDDHLFDDEKGTVISILDRGRYEVLWGSGEVSTETDLSIEWMMGDE